MEPGLQHPQEENPEANSFLSLRNPQKALTSINHGDIPPTLVADRDPEEGRASTAVYKLPPRQSVVPTLYKF